MHIQNTSQKEGLVVLNVTSKNRQRQKQASQSNRLKIISSFRNIELEELDKNDSKKCNIDSSKSDTNSIDDRLVPVSKKSTTLMLKTSTIIITQLMQF
jgi:hypothetical protein